MGAVEFTVKYKDDTLTVEGNEAQRVIKVTGGLTLSINTSVTPPQLEISASSLATAASLATLSTALTALTTRVTNAETAATALAARVTELERKQFAKTALKTASYTAAAWEHVLVDMGSASADVEITLPTSPAPTINDRVRITDVAADGGVGGGLTLKILGTFAVPGSAGYASSPYSVAYSAGDGGSLEGATIELVYVGTGWFVVSEGAKPARLL